MIFKAYLANVIIYTFLVVREHVLNAGMENYCVPQPVESSTTERERDDAVLPRNKSYNVNSRAMLTLT
jgi:hypothetical protein